MALRAVHRDVGVAQQLVGVRAASDGDADARRHVQPRRDVSRQRERLAQRFQQPLGDQLRAGRDRQLLGQDDELVAAETPERVGLANRALQARRDGAQQLVAGAVAERVVDQLEVVEVDEHGRDRRPVPARARQQLLGAIEDQLAVRKPRQRVVRRQERELVVGALALGLERLAHPHERHVEAALQHRDRPREQLRLQRERARRLTRDVRRGVEPAQAALRDLVQRRVALRGELAEDRPRLLPDVARDFDAFAGHPLGDRERRDASDLGEAVLDGVVEHDARVDRPSAHPRDDRVGARSQLAREPAEIVGVLPWDVRQRSVRLPRRRLAWTSMRMRVCVWSRHGPSVGFA